MKQAVKASEALFDRRHLVFWVVGAVVLASALTVPSLSRIFQLSAPNDASTGRLPPGDEADILIDQDERTRRRFRETKSVDHLARAQPSMRFDAPLLEIGEDCVCAAERHHRELAEQDADLREHVSWTKQGKGDRKRSKPRAGPNQGRPERPARRRLGVHFRFWSRGRAVPGAQQTEQRRQDDHDREWRAQEEEAEIGASLLGAHLRLPPHHIHDHASYIGHWMKLLAGDKRAFLTAAAQAQVAVDWLLEKSPSPFAEEEISDVAA